MTMTPDELYEEVVVAPRSAYVALPDLQVIERAGWHQIITPSFRRGGFNAVSLAVLDPGEADAVIDATIAQYRAAGIRFRWSVDRLSAPPDLSERLARRGLVAREVVGMARPTTGALAIAPAGPPASPPDVDISDAARAVTVERVDRETEPSFTAVMAAGWDVDPAPLAIANRCALADPERQCLYLARYGGQPAAVAASVMFPRSVYLLGAVVLPGFRRAGLYRALVATRLGDAAAAGRAIATCHARATTSAPLLARAGFTEIARWHVYEG